MMMGGMMGGLGGGDALAQMLGNLGGGGLDMQKLEVFASAPTVHCSVLFCLGRLFGMRLNVRQMH